MFGRRPRPACSRIRRFVEPSFDVACELLEVVEALDEEAGGSTAASTNPSMADR